MAEFLPPSVSLTHIIADNSYINVVRESKRPETVLSFDPLLSGIFPVVGKKHVSCLVVQDPHADPKEYRVLYAGNKTQLGAHGLWELATELDQEIKSHELIGSISYEVKGENVTVNNSKDCDIDDPLLKEALNTYMTMSIKKQMLAE